MEKQETEMMRITCYDGTILELPDDNVAVHELGSVNAIYAESDKIPAACRKYIIYRPPLSRRLRIKLLSAWKKLKS